MRNLRWAGSIVPVAVQKGLGYEENLGSGSGIAAERRCAGPCCHALRRNSAQQARDHDIEMAKRHDVTDTHENSKSMQRAQRG